MNARYLLLALAGIIGAGLWIAADRTPTSEPAASPAAEYRVSGPFTHGNLSVFLLQAPDTLAERPVLGLDEALANGQAVMHETGSVGELAVENLSAEADLLLLGGDIVKGGKQDRAIYETRLVPPKSGRVPVRSFCVEQGRWTGRKSDDAGKFAANPGMVAGKVKQAVQLAGDQGQVWQTVAGQQGLLGRYVGESVTNAESPTSLQLALENKQVEGEVKKYRDALRRRVGDRPDVIGFVTVVNGRVTGAEAFGSHTLFTKAWAKALDSAAVEAVSEKTEAPFATVSASDVRAFLAIAGGTRQNIEPKEVILPDLGVTVRAVIPLTIPPPLPADAVSDTYVLNGIAPSQAKALLEALQGSDGTIRRTMDTVRGETLVEPPAANMQFTADDQLGTLVVRGLSRDDVDRSRRILEVVLSHGRSLGRNPSPERPMDLSAYIGHSGIVPGAQPIPSPVPLPLTSSTAAVVEYRDGRANGAVIHRSFLAK